MTGPADLPESPGEAVVAPENETIEALSATTISLACNVNVNPLVTIVANGANRSRFA
jgi:hypothetical protein